MEVLNASERPKEGGHQVDDHPLGDIARCYGRI